MAVFIYFAFPGMASKTRPTSWYDRTSLFYFAIRKLTTEVFFIKMKCNDPNPKELFVVVVKILAYSWCCSIISSSLHSCHENVTSRLYSTFIFSLKFTLSPHCSLHNEIVLWVYSTSTQQELRSSFTNKHCQRNNGPKALSTLTHSTPFSSKQKLQQALKSWSIFSLLLFGKGRETQTLPKALRTQALTTLTCNFG